jgi:hypothetical protein
MSQSAPFAGRPNNHTSDVEYGLRNMAFRLIASPDVASRISGKDVRAVVYGNFCDVVTWEELLAAEQGSTPSPART